MYHEFDFKFYLFYMAELIKKIVLTWWPCSWKTSALAHIKSTFEDRWISVLIVPEAATLIFRDIWASISQKALSVLSFQESLIATQIQNERLVENIAKEYGGKVLIILDRWILDSKAYVDDGRELDRIFLNHGLHESSILSERYDWVIHMTTAADGAEQFYTTENNIARSETPEQARILDKRLQQAYVWSLKLSVIDNSSDFRGKLLKVEQEISHILGIPEPIEKENKYHVRVRNRDNLYSISRKVNIEQTYLSEIWNMNEERVRARSVDNAYPTYFHTRKIPFGDDRIETERIIWGKEYFELKQKWVASIKKVRYCFLYKWQYFELDVFNNISLFWQNEALLEIELTKNWSIINIPDFLEVIEDVTQNPNFKNRILASR